MSESKKFQIPIWQRSQSDAVEPAVVAESSPDSSANTCSTPESEPQKYSLEQARKFLSDENVRKSSKEEKMKFLKGKGYSDDDIGTLMPLVDKVDSTADAEPASDMSEQTSDPQPPVSNYSVPNDTPPIITYPEFLVKPLRPPPLITPTRLSNILAVSGGIWTVLYGLSHFVVNPMANELNQARGEYYAHVKEKLINLVAKLESTASVVPYKNRVTAKTGNISGEGDGYADNDSIVSDPTELFHRDVATQTSPQDTLLSPRYNDQDNSTSSQNPLSYQVARLATIRAQMQELSDANGRRLDKTAELSSAVRELTAEFDDMTAASAPDFSTYGGGFTFGRPSESNDEFKKTKDAIRSIKGLFLSARSFPVAAR